MDMTTEGWRTTNLVVDEELLEMSRQIQDFLTTEGTENTEQNALREMC
jgi:hypothetical protein